MHRILSVLLIFSMVLMAGCSGLSKKDCLNTDWRNTGFQDGQSGKTISQMDRYVASCDKHNVSINIADYQAGFDQGLIQYCKPNNGYQIGLSGRALPLHCPADLQAAFSEAHAKGMVQYKINTDIINAKNAMNAADKAISSNESQMIDATALMMSANLQTDKRAANSKVEQFKAEIKSNQQKHQNATGLLACASENWNNAGQTDALKGRATSTYSTHVTNCLSYHAKGNQSSYLQGHAKGLLSYCTKENGYQLGSRNISLAPLCNGASRKNAQRGHKEGLSQYNAKIKVAVLSLNKERLEKELIPLKDAVKKAELQKNKPGLTKNQKAYALDQFRKAERNLQTVELQIFDITGELNCHIGDWYKIGFQAGEQGEKYNNTSKSCPSYGVTTDQSQYQIGYNKGVLNYCTYANGQKVGSTGYEYLEVCPRSVENDFLNGYLPAIADFKRVALRKELSSDIKANASELTQVTNRINDLTQDLSQTGLTRNERLDIINRISKLSDKEQILSQDSSTLNDHFACLTDSWYKLGNEHASTGKVNQINEMNCRRFSIDVNGADYRNGYRNGLKTWCTFDNGLNIASSGNEHNRICSRTEHRNFYQGFNQGLTQLNRTQTIAALNEEKTQLTDNLTLYGFALTGITEQLAVPNITEAKKLQLTKEKIALQAKKIAAQTRLSEINTELTKLSTL